MKKFLVTLSRSAFVTLQIEVEAESHDEAAEAAEEKFGGIDSRNAEAPYVEAVEALLVADENALAGYALLPDLKAISLSLDDGGFDVADDVQEVTLPEPMPHDGVTFLTADLHCPECGRFFEGDDVLKPGNKCPADDCPSNQPAKKDREDS